MILNGRRTDVATRYSEPTTNHSKIVMHEFEECLRRWKKSHFRDLISIIQSCDQILLCSSSSTQFRDLVSEVREHEAKQTTLETSQTTTSKSTIRNATSTNSVIAIGRNIPLVQSPFHPPPFEKSPRKHVEARNCQTSSKSADATPKTSARQWRNNKPSRTREGQR
jgi:hypothetical protein